jgi:hypothetical protein
MTVPPQLTFMAILTLVLVSCVQGASIYMLAAAAITAQEYLSVWVPLMTLAVGYWFGKQGASAT